MERAWVVATFSIIVVALALEARPARLPDVKIAGWVLIVFGVVLVPVALVLNATFASTRFIDDRIGVYTDLTDSGSVVPLVVAGVSAAAVIAGIVLVLKGRTEQRAVSVPSEPRTIAPGWYPHGNIQRYWDGTAWTDDTAPLA